MVIQSSLYVADPWKGFINYSFEHCYKIKPIKSCSKLCLKVLSFLSPSDTSTSSHLLCHAYHFYQCIHYIYTDKNDHYRFVQNRLCECLCAKCILYKSLCYAGIMFNAFAILYNYYAQKYAGIIDSTRIRSHALYILKALAIPDLCNLINFQKVYRF